MTFPIICLAIFKISKKSYIFAIGYTYLYGKTWTKHCRIRPTCFHGFGYILWFWSMPYASRQGPRLAPHEWYIYRERLDWGTATKAIKDKMGVSRNWVGIVLNYFGSVDNGGHSLRTEKIFVGKTSSGFPEDINREDEVTLTSVSCVQPRLNAQIYWLKSPFILTSFSVQPRLNAKTSWVQGNEEMSMCSISNGKWGINCLYRNRAGW